MMADAPSDGSHSHPTWIPIMPCDRQTQLIKLYPRCMHQGSQSGKLDLPQGSSVPEQLGKEKEGSRGVNKKKLGGEGEAWSTNLH